MAVLPSTPPSSPLAKGNGAAETVPDNGQGILTPPDSPRSITKRKYCAALPIPLRFCLENTPVQVLEQDVGSGQWSTVSKAAVGDLAVAIKSPRGKQARAILQREAQVLTVLMERDESKEYVVPFHGLDASECRLVLDYMPHSLESQIRQRVSTPSREELLALTRHLVAGLGFLQDCNVIHGDIKPGNILLTENDRALYCDFSASRLDDPSTPPTESAGTYDFMAPELFSWRDEESTPSRASDVFALGMTIIYVALGHSPYEEYAGSYMKVSIAKQGRPLQLVQDGPEALLAERLGLASLVSGALHKDVALRWTVSEWLRHLSRL